MKALPFALLALLTGCVSVPPPVLPKVVQVGSWGEAIQKASMFQRDKYPGAHLLPINGTTGSMARTQGSRRSWCVGVPVSTRDLRFGEEVIRKDINVHHRVVRTEGPLVFTQGTSNQYEDAIPISGDVYRVVAIFQYDDSPATTRQVR